MSLYPYNPSLGQRLRGHLGHAANAFRCQIARLRLSTAQAVASSTTGVHAAVTDTGVPQTVTTAITAPPYARSITATAGGTAGDIKAITVTINGTNDAGEVISEVLPAFTVNTAGTVEGNYAFKTVTSIVIPAHDGVGATTAIGFGDKIGIAHCLPRNSVQQCYVNLVEEPDAPTVVFDDNEVHKNTVLLATALAGTVVDIYYFVG